MELAPSPGGARLRPQVGWGFAPLAAASSPVLFAPFEKVAAGRHHPKPCRSPRRQRGRDDPAPPEPAYSVDRRSRVKATPQGGISSRLLAVRYTPWPLTSSPAPIRPNKKAGLLAPLFLTSPITLLRYQDHTQRAAYSLLVHIPFLSPIQVI